jgi:hypothetical protein
MANEIKSQIATKSGINLPETLLRDASQAPQGTLNSELKPIIPVCLYLNQRNGIQLPAAIGASQLEDNTFGMNVRANVREEGLLTSKNTGAQVFGGITVKNIDYTVPNDHIWLIKFIQGTWAGTATVANLNFYILNKTGDTFCLKIVTTPVVNTTYVVENYLWGGVIFLPEGWTIRASFNATADTNGTGTLKMLYQDIAVL